MGIQAEAMGVPVEQITADWNSPVVREALLHKGVGRRTRRLLVQVQGAAAERRNANIHLLRRITDVARRSRWAHFAEITDLHLADLRRQAEEHHRDRKPDPFSKKGRLPRTLCDVQAVLAAGVQQDCEQ